MHDQNDPESLEGQQSFNPEIGNQTQSPSHNSLPLENNKLHSIYQNLARHNQQYRAAIHSSHCQPRKAYSSADKNNKPNIHPHKLKQTNNQTLSGEQFHPIKKKRKPKVCKSAEKGQLSIPIEEQERMFNRITIHCLKARREAVEEYTKEVESQYSFFLKKIASLKRNRHLQQLKESRISLIKQENRKMSEQMHKNHEIASSMQRQQKQQLRKQVLAHRSSRKEMLLKKMEANCHSASEQRLFSKQIHTQIEDKFWHDYEEKKRKCQKERSEYEQRRSMISKKVEARKEQARKQFRRRWLHELEKAENAKAELQTKQQQVKDKISQAMRSYNQLLTQKA